MRAKFEFTDVPAGLPADSIVIQELTNPAEPTIAQDAEAVVQTLFRVAAKAGDEIGPNQPGLYAYDECGQLDQLLHDGSNFTGFVADIGETHGGN